MESRLKLALLAYAFGALGLFLLVCPWTAVWTEGTVVLLPTPLGSWVRSGWLRGAVSGLGAVDLLVALQVSGQLIRHPREKLAPRAVRGEPGEGCP